MDIFADVDPDDLLVDLTMLGVPDWILDNCLAHILFLDLHEYPQHTPFLALAQVVLDLLSDTTY